jgi:hypothetical protein
MTSAYRRLPLAAVLAVSFLTAFAPPARADEAQTQRAKELFQQGTTLFNVGDFDKAIEAWQQGYKERPDPGFLYNIGQAYRLKGDAAKAIFFYRGYLRNSPKAANRADVEAKIVALQKGVDEHPAGTPPATTPPATTSPPAVTTAPPKAPPPAPRPAPVVAPRPAPAPTRATTSPPPVAAPPLAVGAPPPAEVVTTEMPPEPAAPGRNRHFDVAVGVGFNNFTSGLNIKGSAPAQGALNLGGGFVFGHDTWGPVSFRLGGLLTITSLKEGAGSTANELGFTSLLLEPSARFRLVDHRLYLTGGLGLGVLFISGVKSTSVVLAPLQMGKSYDVKGTQAGFELRPAATLHFHFADWIAAYASPALSFMPKKPNYQGTIGRFELTFGVAFLF